MPLGSNPHQIDSGKQPTICLGFDGVIHHYTSWTGPEATGKLIQETRHALECLARMPVRLEIFSSCPKREVKRFLRKHRLLHFFHKIRDNKPYYIALFDDRAYHVPSNTPGALHDAIHQWLTNNHAQNPR